MLLVISCYNYSTVLACGERVCVRSVQSRTTYQRRMLHCGELRRTGHALTLQSKHASLRSPSCTQPIQQRSTNPEMFRIIWDILFPSIGGGNKISSGIFGMGMFTTLKDCKTYDKIVSNFHTAGFLIHSIFLN